MPGRYRIDPSREPDEEERPAIGRIEELLIGGLEEDRPHGITDSRDSGRRPALARGRAINSAISFGTPGMAVTFPTDRR